MKKYDKITDEMFDAMLVEILDETTGTELLSIPGVYEAVIEHFNNEVLDKCMSKLEEKENDEEN